MPLLTEPVTTADARMLRTAVLDLRLAERGPSFPTCLHLGRPGSPHARLTDDVEDPAMRTDLIGALLRRHGPPALVWLTRPGPLSWHDADARWLSPASRAFAEAGVSLTWVVVTRRGWWDPRGGARKEWKRLRPRS